MLFGTVLHTVVLTPTGVGRNHIFDFSQKYFSKIIFENRVMKNKLQKVFCSNYLVYTYFLLNPKALEAPFSRRSNAPSNIQIRQKLAKLS